MYFVVLLSLVFLLGSGHAQLTSSEEIDISAEYEEDYQRDQGERKDLSGRLISEISYQSSNQGKRRALRRITRSTFDSLTKQYIPAVENIIIANCQANEQYDAAEKLQVTFDEMKTCLRKKKIFVTPREEFLVSIEECSKESVKKSKECLAANQRYFPDFIMDLARSVTNFLYNDFDIIRVDMVSCYPKLANTNALYAYKQCLVEVDLRAESSHLIPPTKAEFCEKFIPGAYCFTNMVKENCDRTAGLAKYRDDYIKSHKEPCEGKGIA